MAFISGFELLEMSVSGNPAGSISSITLVEGPEIIERVTLRVSTLFRDSVESSVIEIQSDLFPQLNEAAHQNGPVFSSVGKERLSFYIEMPSYGVTTGCIYPNTMYEPKVLFDYRFDGMPMMLASARRLGNGFAFSSSFLLGVLAVGALGIVAYEVHNTNQIIGNAVEKGKTVRRKFGFGISLGKDMSIGYTDEISITGK